jgi:hypothetical protein
MIVNAEIHRLWTSAVLAQFRVLKLTKLRGF